MLPRILSAAFAVTLLTGPAHADATRDLKAGTSVMVRVASASVGTATMTSGGVATSKPGGTLDITLAAVDLGMPVPVTLHLRGTSLGGGHMLFSVDDEVAPALDLGGGQSLTRITGQLYAYASRVPGKATPQIGNVKLTFPDSSYVIAYGTWGKLRVDITNATLISGVTQPALAVFVNNGESFVCSDSVETAQPLVVRLGDPAQTGGAAVDLESSQRGVRVPKAVTVRAGRLAAITSAQIAPNFVGLVRVTAAAGGVTRSFDLDVHPRHHCESGPATTPALQSWLPNSIAGCTNCTSFVDVDRHDDKLTTIGGRLALIRGTSVTDLLAAFPAATAVTAVAMTNDDTITGRMTVKGTTQAYRANLTHGSPPVLLGDMTPTAINNYDVVVGSRIANGANQAVYNNGAGIVPLLLRSGYGIQASRAFDITETGEIVGSYTDKAGNSRGFRWRRGTTTTLPVLGAKPAIPVDINNAGQIAVNGMTSLGQPLAGVVSRTGVLAPLGAPSGYSTFEAKSINQFGTVAGIAKTTSGGIAIQRAFVWRAGHGFTALTNYVPNLTATDALRITDANQVVVRGTLAGVADLYLITL